MRLIKILRTKRPLFSDDKKTVNFFGPRCWQELNQDQLRYVLFLLSTYSDHVVVKTYMFIRFSGIHVISRDKFGWKCFVRVLGKRKFITLQPWQIESLISQFNYIDNYEMRDVRLEKINGLRAVDPELHGFRFADYLNAEKYYQAYNINKNDRFLKQLALILYRKRNGSMARKIKMDRAELLGVFLWYSYVKYRFSKAFPHFFKKIPIESAGSYDFIQSMNAQIRALTEGDVTKEDLIFNTDCWRALTELDQKAREAEEFNAKYNK